MKNLLRKNIERLQAYRSARHEYMEGKATLLDANENPFTSSHNRYPDPFCSELKSALAVLRDRSSRQIFLGNGSDEAIDLLFRAYCEPGKDRVMQFIPTYGMYKVSADIHDIKMLSLPLNHEFQIDLNMVRELYPILQPKLVFICSPNNPTGNIIDNQDIERVLSICGQSLVIVDEAYIDFAPHSSVLAWIDRFPNLVVLQTFSKAWGLAGIRLGVAYAPADIIEVLDRLKAPYNISVHTQKVALEAINDDDCYRKAVKKLLAQRQWLSKQLSCIKEVEYVYPSDANFLLVRFKKAEAVMTYLKNHKIIVRDQTKKVPDCLRISVGTESENIQLVQLLSQYTS